MGVEGGVEIPKTNQLGFLPSKQQDIPLTTLDQASQKRLEVTLIRTLVGNWPTHR